MDQLHVFFFPLMAYGHMLPAIDMANLFSSRGVKATLITTPQHVPMFTKAIERSRNAGFDISIRTIKFPASEVGLPEGIESPDLAVNSDHDMLPKFLTRAFLLQEPLEQLLQEYRPHFLVADICFSWATKAAAKFDIPRLIFHISNFFMLSTAESVRRNKPFENVSSDSELFVVPDLPHQIKLTRTQISKYERENTENDFTEILKQIWEAEETSFGVLVNSFYELEPEYVDYYTNVLGRKAWHIGPYLLWNKEPEYKVHRGKKSAIDADKCLNWLDSKEADSVIYVCFGSLANFRASQFREIAMALESAGQQFIWVVRECIDEENSENWFPEGFVERTREKGLIIKGWAPQTLILEHEAVGAFISHCGWNSALEGICAGVPMVTWPVFAEQFYNEKLLTEVLKIGVAVGVPEWSIVPTDIIKREAITNALNQVMVDNEALEMRSRAKALKEKARKAMEEGGSSYFDLTALLEELSVYHSARKQE